MNYFLRSPQGQQYFHTAIENKKTYSIVIDSILKQGQVPKEFSAIPIVESQYINTEIHKFPYSAGLWMFIPETARHYGLVVNESRDDRKNVEMETLATVKYMSFLWSHYKDWRLAVIAYNVGEHQVDTMINQEHTRDPWELLNALPKTKVFEEPRNYLPTVEAAMILEEKFQALKTPN